MDFQIGKYATRNGSIATIMEIEPTPDGVVDSRHLGLTGTISGCAEAGTHTHFWYSDGAYSLNVRHDFDLIEPVINPEKFTPPNMGSGAQEETVKISSITLDAITKIRRRKLADTAMEALLKNPIWHHLSFNKIAKQAFDMADAMIDEEDKRYEPQ